MSQEPLQKKIRGDTMDMSEMMMTMSLKDPSDRLTVNGTDKDTLAKINKFMACMSDTDVTMMVDRELFKVKDGSDIIDLPNISKRLRNIYFELDRLKVVRVIDAIHERLRYSLEVTRSWTITDIIQVFQCHPGVISHVIAPVGDRLQVYSARMEAEEHIREMEEDGPDNEDVVKMIGELRPGQCVLIACEMSTEGDNNNPAPEFCSGAMICRIPSKIVMPPPEIRKTSPKIKKGDIAKFSGKSKEELDSLPDDERRRLIEEYKEDMSHKGNWRRVIMEPELDVGGHAGDWLRWFIASIAAERDPSISRRTIDKSYFAGIVPHASGPPCEMKYIVFTHPSPCGPGIGAAVTVSCPDTWLGEDYGDIELNGDIGDDEDANEEAFLYSTIEEAVAAATDGRIEMIAKTLGLSVEPEIVHRTTLFKQLERTEQDNIMLGGA